VRLCSSFLLKSVHFRRNYSKMKEEKGRFDFDTIFATAIMAVQCTCRPTG